ncbi:MAG: hypothetical protein IT572_07320 [Deltaproteobacteria bacterium]|nr:hypothetical protein [Deltaproteobacteria bacterium]
MQHRPVAGARHRPESRGAADFAAAEVLARPLALARGAAREELRALARETDPDLFLQGLLACAARREAAGDLELAAELYSAVEQHAAAAGALREGPLRNRAQGALDAIVGRGAAGPRAEFLLRRFAEQASDPAALFAMGAAGAVFRLTRVATLGRLAVSPGANLFTRGFGARATASLAGFALEAPAFTLAGRAANAALGREQDWSGGVLARDFASSYLVLGGLKLAGWLSGSLYRGLAGPAGAVRERPLQILFQQGGMLGGIVLGHSLEERFGLRFPVEGATTLVDSLAMLLQFNVAGNLTRQAFGPRFAAWERGLDLRAETVASLLPPRLSGPGFGAPEFAWAGPTPDSTSRRPAAGIVPPHAAAMVMHGEGLGGGEASPVRLPRMGIRRPLDNPSTERLNRQEAERQLRALVPRGFVEAADLQSPHFVSRLLTCFGVTDHPFDQGAFRRGFEIARAHPERVARLAFDVDEVYLHWAFSPADLFRGTMERGAEAVYRHTEPGLLDYPAFRTVPGVKLNVFERLWFDGVQRLFPGRLRQRVQFHPGVRAFQLGLRLGQDKNLIMATTGPAGRILRLANEDPAMKMIYFGKGPAEPVTIAEVREGLNIYTREDLVLAMREAADGEIRYPENPLVESYLAKIREFPANGVKLKHPAIALLRGKRPFDTLVDDSASTFAMLGGMEGFAVLQPPSARPSRTLNFTFLSPDHYLDRMANGYVHELGEILAGAERPASRRLDSGITAPEDYPFQRFAIEIPWDKFGAEFVAPNRELRLLGRRLARALPAAAPAAEAHAPLSLSEAQLQSLTERLHREFERILDERPGTVSVEAAHTAMLRDLAQGSPEDFQAMVDLYFTSREQSSLPQASRPLAERGSPYFARLTAVLAAKQAVCQLLGLDPAQYSKEVLVRQGRAVLTGEAARRQGTGHVLTSYAEGGEVGLGVALIEPDIWSSGLTSFGLGIAGERTRRTNTAQLALAHAAHKATRATHDVQQFNHHRVEEIQRGPGGAYLLTGRTLQAARELRGDAGSRDPLAVWGLDFRIGEATVALVAVPSLDRGGTRRARLSPFGFGEAPPAPAAFPEPVYLSARGGQFTLPRENMRVAILGDVSGMRAVELGRRGHYPLSIERDPEMLEMTERLFESERAAFSREGGRRPMRGEFVLGDWYETSVQAERVEAYFPLHVGDIPRPEDPARPAAVAEFLDRALLSKIVPGGGGYVVSEHAPLIRDLADLVSRRPDLELVSSEYHHRDIPIVAGYAVASPFRDNSWLVFRRRP